MKFSDEPPRRSGWYWAREQLEGVECKPQPVRMRITEQLHPALEVVDYLDTATSEPATAQAGELLWGDRIEEPEVDA